MQGTIAWPAVAATGVRFAMVRCADGNNSPDHTFRTNIDGARAAGIPVGAYHGIFPLTHIDPIQQANAHYTASGGLGSSIGELPPGIDLEWPAPQNWVKWGCTAPQIRAWALAYLAESARLHGCKPMVYVYPDFAIHLQVANEPAFAEYPLWMADYTPPFDPVAPWKSAVMFQTSGGTALKLPGGVPVDEDIIADEDTLAALLFRQSPESPIEMSR